MNEWNDRIREAREAKYLPSKGVAEIVGISPVYYCNIEKEKRMPKKGILAKICETLDLDFQEMANLLGYSEREIN